jgi:FlaG/FlaF family flagellin (archaellin)
MVRLFRIFTVAAAMFAGIIFVIGVILGGAIACVLAAFIMAMTRFVPANTAFASRPASDSAPAKIQSHSLIHNVRIALAAATSALGARVIGR